MSTANVKNNLADHVAIIQLINGYTDAVNRRDWTALADVFCEDGVWDVGGPDAGPLSYYFTGRGKVVDGIRGLVDGMSMFVQTVHAPIIAVDGNSATATCTLEERGRPASGDQSVHLFGTYYDTIVRDGDGEWRFKKRSFRFTYVEPTQYNGQIMATFPVDRPA